MMRKTTSSSGFTLVEMIVAVALFAVVMVVCVAALLSLVNANRKAQALQSVMNNLNIALDGMVRAVRMGSNYRCASVDPVNPDCVNGAHSLYFTPYGGTASDTADDWVYAYSADANGIGRIYKSVDGQALAPITAPEVSIDDMNFYVVNTDRDDAKQPKVVIVIKGSAGASGSQARTTFHIQATAVQRVLDL